MYTEKEEKEHEEKEEEQKRTYVPLQLKQVKDTPYTLATFLANRCPKLTQKRRRIPRPSAG